MLLRGGSWSGNERLLLHLRHGTHRVKDGWLVSDTGLVGVPAAKVQLLPLESLERLVLPDGTVTSYYETEGERRGYVKNSQKIWERLLISWWALDYRVGEDKKLGMDTSDGEIFYTSLKPWAREASDMRDFRRFLRYWGWNL